MLGVGFGLPTSSIARILVHYYGLSDNYRGTILDHNPFLALLLITGLALIIPVVLSRFQRLRIPIVVGEIVAGIIIGKSGFNLVEPSQTLSFLAEFGFAFLMFLSGLEIDFNLLQPTNPEVRREKWYAQPLPLSVLVFLATVGLAMVSSMLLSSFEITRNPLLVGLILSTTSLGVVVPILKERRLLGTQFGQYMLVAGSIADFAALLLLTVAIGIQSSGLTLDLLLIPVLLLVFVLVARAGPVLARIPLLQRIVEEVSTATAQIRVRGALALMVGWVVLAEALGVELILGAFLAGAIAGLIAGPGEADSREKLDAIGYGFFIPIFFIMVGVEFNLSVLFESSRAILLLPILAGIGYVVKLVPGLLYRTIFPWRETLSGGFLLSARLSLIVAASAIALDIGAVSEAFNSAAILLAIVTVTLSPLIFHRIFPVLDEEHRRGVIITGQDQLAEFLAERLLEVKEPVVVVCPDASRLEAFRQMDVPIVTGCKDQVGALMQAGAEKARALVDLTTSSEETLEVCTLAREQFDIPLVVSRISDVELIPHLIELGVKVVQPALATAMALEGALRYPSAFDVLVHRAENVDVGEIGMTNRTLQGVPLRRIRLPGDALIVSLQRGQEISVPDGDTVLEYGDQIGLIGSPEALKGAVDLLSG